MDVGIFPSFIMSLYFFIRSMMKFWMSKEAPDKTEAEEVIFF